VVARDDRIHLVAVTRDTPPWVAAREVEQSMAVARAATQASHDTGKPILMFSNMSVGSQDDVKHALTNGGIPYLQGTRETLRALQAFFRYAGFRRRFNQPAPRGCPSPSNLPQLQAMFKTAQRTFPELDGRRLLAAYGIPGPQEAVATTADEAAKTARHIGYPVALKILSPDILHKTDIGGVRLNLQSDVEVVAAFHEIINAARDRFPAAALEGVLIQEMITPQAVEVILGILRDPDFGPIVVYGSGGVLTEILQDSALRLPPISTDEAMQMINETRGARLLRGFRQRPTADVEALAEALVRFSQLAADLGDVIAAMDINPLMVLPAGQGVRAVDVVVETTQPPAAHPTKLPVD
jgi:acetyltransferase